MFFSGKQMHVQLSRLHAGIDCFTIPHLIFHQSLLHCSLVLLTRSLPLLKQLRKDSMPCTAQIDSMMYNGACMTCFLLSLLADFWPHARLPSIVAQIGGIKKIFQQFFHHYEVGSASIVLDNLVCCSVLYIISSTFKCIK